MALTVLAPLPMCLLPTDEITEPWLSGPCPAGDVLARHDFDSEAASAVMMTFRRAKADISFTVMLFEMMSFAEATARFEGDDLTRISPSQ